MQDHDARTPNAMTDSDYDNDAQRQSPHEEEPRTGIRILNEESNQNTSHAQPEPETPWLGSPCDKTKDCMNAAKRRLQLEAQGELEQNDQVKRRKSGLWPNLAPSWRLKDYVL